MLLLIDNYDSFSYNLFQYIGQIEPDIRVIRNDEMTARNIIDLKPDAIIISPGPGKPSDAGICEELIREVKGDIPILGVCLGHQAICEAYGAKIVHARYLMHGKQSRIRIDTSSKIFEGLPEKIDVARYHSLAASPDTISDDLKVIAVTDDDEIMAVSHKEYPVYGLQFHPESIMTPEGMKILKNFIQSTKAKDRWQ